jgi:hypothetical protein
MKVYNKNKEIKISELISNIRFILETEMINQGYKIADIEKLSFNQLKHWLVNMRITELENNIDYGEFSDKEILIALEKVFDRLPHLERYYTYESI